MLETPHNGNYNFLKLVVNARKDFFASITVFLVALPLCIGIAVASGLPPETGILSGIIGGLVVGLFTGSPLQVSGPAAGLIIIVHDIVKMQGIQELGIIIMIAGIIQICFGLLKLGHWFRAISPAIIQGMLTGIGLSILMSQLYIMLDAIPKSTFIQNINYFPTIINNGFFQIDGTTHHIAATMGLITISIIVLWKFAPKRLKAIPATLFAVIFVSIISFFFDLPIKFISVSGDIFKSINLVPLNKIHNLVNKDFLIDALGVAFIASAETLLTSTAVDKMNSLYKTNYNKEIFAQGLGNFLAGMVGALPITGVIVRSAANIQAGAKTKLSTILHGTWILLFVSTLPFIFKYIPTSCLAAILVYTGYKLVNIETAKTIFRYSKGEFIVYLITIISILATNLLEGIIIGLFAGILRSLYKLTKFDITIKNNIDENKLHILVSGNLTFLRLPQFAEIIEGIEQGRNVEIDFINTAIIDHAIIDLLEGWSARYTKGKGTVTINWDFLKAVYPSFGWHQLDTNSTTKND